MDWFRWYIGTCTDAKVHKASRIANCRRSAVIAAWAAILEEARRHGDNGDTGVIEPSWLAGQIDEPERKCAAILIGMTEVELIKAGSVPAFPRRQYTSDNSTPRVQKHRAAKEKSTFSDSHLHVATHARPVKHSSDFRKSLDSRDSHPLGNGHVKQSETHQNRTESNKESTGYTSESPTHRQSQSVPLGERALACLEPHARSPDQHVSPEPTGPLVKPNGHHPNPASWETMTKAEAEADRVRRREEFLRKLEESSR